MSKHVQSVKVFLIAIFAVAFTGMSQELYAQKRSVSGVVTGDDKVPLPGVSIVEEGTTNGTTTDADGKFSFDAPENATLIFSFIGMKTVKISIGTQTTFQVTLESDMATLSEVVVIGYGTVERKDLTTSVSSIGAKQIKDIPINSAAQALAGRLAGVQVTATEGSPDAQVKIRVRGGGSISQDNSPIYVVDGVQVENALDILAPQDIESIDVLKDAAATAIYGARGANGIVVITTKGGRQQKTQVSFSSLIGVRELANKLEVWKPYDFVKYQYERSRGSDASEKSFLEDYGAYEDMELYNGVPFTDWQDEVFGRSAVMQTYNIGINGGNEVSSFNLSATSNKEEGIMLSSDFDRKLINFRFNTKVGKLIDVGFNVRYNYTLVNGAGTSSESSSSVNRLRHSVKYRPFLMPGQSVDTYDDGYASETNANSLALINPVLLTAADYKQDKKHVANINGYASIKLTKFLTFRTTLGYDITDRQVRVFNDTITTVSKSNGQGLPIASIETRNISILNNSNVLTFSSDNLKSIFGDAHKLDVMVGQEILERKEYLNFQQNYYFPIGITPDLAFGSMELGTPQPTSGTEEIGPEKLLSFFGRANYAYNDKYLLSVTMRADGSSKFAAENRWGYFPGASVAWRISSEPFFQDLTNTINDFKFRMSYGASGNNRIDNFLYLSTFEPGGSGSFYEINGVQVIGYRPSALSNNNLQWEGIISKNIGLDLGLYSNRLQLSVDYYSNISDQLLLNRVIPSTSGYQTQIQNLGKTSNKGIEIQLSGTPISNDKFTWNANFNISFNKNKIESLGPGLDSYTLSSGWAGGNQPADYMVKVGESVGTIYGFVTDGYYTLSDFDYEAGTGYTLKAGVPSNVKVTSVAPQPGTIKFKDVTTDGEVTLDDRDIIGNASPKFFGGFNNQFTYKNFDLSVFVNFQVGNDVLNANKLEFTSGYTVNSNLLTDMDGRWRNVNDAGEVVTDPTALAELNKDATLWSPLTSASSFYVHSWAVENASFLRLNNITLGYNFSKGLLSKIGITNLRLYGTLNNVAVFTKYSGYDPEVDTRRGTRVTPGVDYSAYPRSKGYIFGLNLTF